MSVTAERINELKQKILEIFRSKEVKPGESFSYMTDVMMQLPGLEGATVDEIETACAVLIEKQPLMDEGLKFRFSPTGNWLQFVMRKANS